MMSAAPADPATSRASMTAAGRPISNKRSLIAAAPALSGCIYDAKPTGLQAACLTRPNARSRAGYLLYAAYCRFRSLDRDGVEVASVPIRLNQRALLSTLRCANPLTWRASDVG